MKRISSIYTQFLSNCRHSSIAFVVLLCMLFTGACRKDKVNENHPAVVQVLNVMDDGLLLSTNLSGKHPINYAASMWLYNKSFLRSQNTLYIGQYPQPIDLYAIPDTMPHNSPLISTTLDVKAGSLYSLFVHGSKTSPAHTLVQEHFPQSNGDSVTYIKFANFSEGPPVSINLKGAVAGSFVQSLSFRSVSTYTAIPLNSSVEFYEFEVRDQLTGDSLTTYKTTLMENIFTNPWIFKPNTLVLTGTRGKVAPNNQKIIWMSHMQQ